MNELFPDIAAMSGWVRVIERALSFDAFRWLALFLVIGLLFALFRFRREVLAEAPNPIVKFAKCAIALASLFLASRAVFFSAAQFSIWRGSGLWQERLLPPHQPLSYFLGYAWQHFADIPAFTAAAAIAVFALLAFANRFSGGRFFYREEPYLAAFGVLAAPWPAGLLVMLGVMVAGVTAHAVLAGMGKWTRFPLIWFWLPAALIAIAFGDIISAWIGLNQFRV